MIRTILPLSLLPLLLALSPARAQEPTPAQAEEETFFESIDVEVVNLEVFVTDREGKPITGLTREEFEVVEDGKPVEVTNFFGVDAEVREAAPSPAAADPATNPATAPSTGPAPGEQTLHLAIVIDNLTLTPQNRNRLLQSIEKDVLPRLRPANRALVAVVDGSAVRIVQRLTSDPAELRAALEQTTLTAPQGVARMTEKRELLSRIDSVGLQVPGESANLNVNVVEQLYYDLQTYAQQRTLEARTSLGAVSAFVSSLSGLPGRKAMLHVSDGIAVTPGEELFQALAEMCGGGGATSGMSGSGSGLTPADSSARGGLNTYRAQSAMIDAQGYSTAKEWSALAAHANTHRVTLYTLQASGVEAGAASSAEMGTGDRVLQLSSVSTVEMQNRQGSLSVMAMDTGGRAMFNANDVRPELARMRQDFDRYYSLGFTPRRAGDGRDHRLEVRVKRRDLRVRHPLSYRDKPPLERAVDRTLAALLFGNEENPLEVAIEIGDVTPNPQGGYTVPVRLRIPLGKLHFNKTEEAYEGNLRLLVATQSGAGGTSKVRQVQVPIRFPSDKALMALGQEYVYELALTMGAGEQRVAVAVRDEGTSLTSFLARGVRVGSSEGAVRGQF